MGDGIGPTPDIQPPRLRTLLMTDLCDSVTLVERLGDAAAAALFQRHDHLVLELQQQWRGRLIDRSDGLFLLFERPIDGLGFALGYMRGLQDLGEKLGRTLQARAGLHVGEVLTWHNSEEAVRSGAKALEVEGIAKPTAARLLALARPGQVLLSSVAEPLLRRAVQDVTDTTVALVWRSHGRWRFKGLPTAMEVFEVAEAGRAMPRAPRTTAKAWRDRPWWRRGPVLILQAALLCGIIAAVVYLARPEPAIAFAERDWVVLADVRNLTGNVLLDDAMNQAFRVSLEQSRYVNVLSDLKVRDTQSRMRLTPGSPLGRRVAMEVAVREGARAVLLPSVTEMNGKLRIAIEIIEPSTGDTVFTEYADGKGVESALTGADTVVASLRQRLGESLADVRHDSVPLPRVTTSSLDALHAYAKGSIALSDRKLDDARGFFEHATTIDPEFAFAHMALMRIHLARGDVTQATAAYRRAAALKSRMTPRDVLYLDAWGAQLGGDPPLLTANRWKLLTDLYPDYHAGYMNRAATLFALGRYADALEVAQPLLAPQNPVRSHAHDFVGQIELALGDTDAALRDFNASAELSGREGSTRLGMAYAVMGRQEMALETIGRVPPGGPGQTLEKVAVLVDLGRSDEALLLLADLGKGCAGETDSLMCGLYRVVAIAIADKKDGATVHHAELRRLLAGMASGIATDDVADRETRMTVMASTIYVAQRSGMPIQRELALLEDALSKHDDARALQLAEIIRANEARLAGRPQEAVERLSRLVDGSELYQVHVMLRDAQHAAGDADAVQREQQWLDQHRGRAYAENLGNYVLQAMSVRDSRT